MTTFTGKVVSAKYSDYLTQKWGIEEENVKGYTIHVLINKINGEEINLHCFELQCYADYEIRDGEKITYLHLVKPFFENKGVRVCEEEDLAVGDSWITFNGLGFNPRKVTNNQKECRMLRTGLPICEVKRPLITDMWLEDDDDTLGNYGVRPLVRIEADKEEV